MLYMFKKMKHVYGCYYDECDSSICNKCVNENFYMYSDWIDATCKCETCNKIMCRYHMIFCYDCALSGDQINYCENCCPADIKDVSCEYHTWTTCGKKHEFGSGTCRECVANKNYRRYGIE